MVKNSVAKLGSGLECFEINKRTNVASRISSWENGYASLQNISVNLDYSSSLLYNKLV